MKKIWIMLSAILPTLLLVGQLSPVFAEIQVEVSGNGTDTQNSVSATSSQTETVTQQNQAQVQNDVTSSANTGGNEIAGTAGGDTQITTGDITQETSVANDLNNATVASECCGNNEINITVSGNGADSVNTVHTEVSATTTINVTQLAYVNNDVGIYANTGNNTARDNGGNVMIDTGNIKSVGELANIVNQTTLTVGKGAWDITIISEDNGSNSANVVFLDLIKNFALVKNNIVDINNNIYADLNTGNNTALGSLNDVLIKTGDIDFAFNVQNGPINTNKDDVICCDDGEVPEPDDPGTGGPPGPSVPPSPGPNIAGNGKKNDDPPGNSKVGDVLAAMTDILPATGASAVHFWILAVVYLITFLSGLYLRLRAGRSPTRSSRSRFQGYALLTY